MSMEDAINNHAAALRDLSAAIKAMYAGRADALALLPVGDAKTGTATSPARQAIQDALDKAKAGKKGDDKAAEVVDQVSAEIEAKGTVEPDETQTRVISKAEVQAAIDATETQGTIDDRDHEEKALDYAKDVRPLLLQVVRGGKRAEVEAFLAKAGVKKADELPAEKLPALFDLANKLAAEIAAAKAA